MQGSPPPPPSPIPAYSFPSGPKARSPPLWLSNFEWFTVSRTVSLNLPTLRPPPFPSPSFPFFPVFPLDFFRSTNCEMVTSFFLLT